MGRLIDIDVLFDYFGNDAIDEITRGNIEYFVSEKGTVEAIPKAEVRKLLRNNAKKVSDSVLDIVREEYIPKSQYENRLKADLVAMLTDFLMDIEENTSINATNSDERNGKRLMRTEIIGMFEQKINSLKEDGK